jgi:hypothetical protein
LNIAVVTRIDRKRWQRSHITVRLIRVLVLGNVSGSTGASQTSQSASSKSRRLSELLTLLSTRSTIAPALAR